MGYKLDMKDAATITSVGLGRGEVMSRFMLHGFYVDSAEGNTAYCL